MQHGSAEHSMMHFSPVSAVPLKAHDQAKAQDTKGRLGKRLGACGRIGYGSHGCTQSLCLEHLRQMKVYAMQCISI